MRKVFLIMIIVLLLLTGCSKVVPNLPELPEERIPIELIKEYMQFENYLRRWPDGTIIVLDEKGRTENIWKQINKIIDGPVVFEVRKDVPAEEANIWIHYDNTFPINKIWMTYATDHFSYVNYEYYEVKLSPENPISSKGFYTAACLGALGINISKIFEGLSSKMKQVLYWVYRLEAGYPLN